ncbi:MAG: hypothetical protein KC933_04580 [Myxococcales bacterium]|nr:hypothetical protein [Myxococcales bacterium]MCB9648266.1 hypothetical protein [Deltaproteobacteria bacterium]
MLRRNPLMMLMAGVLLAACGGASDATVDADVERGSGHAFVRAQADGRIDFAFQDRIAGTWQDGVVRVVNADGLLVTGLDESLVHRVAEGVAEALMTPPTPQRSVLAPAVGEIGPTYLVWGDDGSAEPHRPSDEGSPLPGGAEPHQEAPLTVPGLGLAEPHRVLVGAEPH